MNTARSRLRNLLAPGVAGRKLPSAQSQNNLRSKIATSSGDSVR
jgi:hypothetical protein